MAISYARHQYPPPVIRHAVWLYLRFTLSFRDVEDLLAERGLDISYETVRRRKKTSAYAQGPYAGSARNCNLNREFTGSTVCISAAFGRNE
jgi:hypothetical protein